MWPERPQKWQTGISMFLTTNLVLDFGFFLNKEQFGLIWPTATQRRQVGTKTDLLCSLTVGLDLGLETLASISELLPLSKIAKQVFSLLFLLKWEI